MIEIYNEYNKFEGAEFNKAPKYIVKDRLSTIENYFSNLVDNYKQNQMYYKALDFVYSNDYNADSISYYFKREKRNIISTKRSNES